MAPEAETSMLQLKQEVTAELMGALQDGRLESALRARGPRGGRTRVTWARNGPFSLFFQCFSMIFRRFLRIFTDF